MEIDLDGVEACANELLEAVRAIETFLPLSPAGTSYDWAIDEVRALLRALDSIDGEIRIISKDLRQIVESVKNVDRCVVAWK